VKFLIDQQLPATLAVWFDQKGHAAEHVRDVGMREASDQLIWRYADERGAIIVTKDEDFAIMRAELDDGPQVLWLRIGNATNRVLRAHLEDVWPMILQWLEAGESIVEA
jgi:predicted nuclease of predicted toxin-antitoxin system